MTLEVYNTLTGMKEVFEKPENNRINFFVCGPTVYDHSHLGHARTYVAFDVIVRYLRSKGHTVFYLMNVTDIDDKMIARADRRDISVKTLADENFALFLEDMARLGVNTVNFYGKATEHVARIIHQIEVLIERGYAYASGGNVYFSIKKFDDFGKLSGQKIDELQEGMRVEDPHKRDGMDFALWKAKKPGEPSWESPWGEGRPGWHIEDTAITNTYFGDQYTVHGGARDLIFPHHEAEIAIAEAYSGKKPFVKYWFHTGFLNVRGEKMSKSLGNFFTIREVLEAYAPEVVRFYLVNTHYRKPIDFDHSRLEEAKQAYLRLKNVETKLASYLDRRAAEGEDGDEADDMEEDDAFVTAVDETRTRFFEAMDNDLNTRDALAELFEFATFANKYLADHTPQEMSAVALKHGLDLFADTGVVLGLFGTHHAAVDEGLHETLDSVVQILIQLRATARAEKDWARADAIRDDLCAQGIVLEDGHEGTIWKRIE